MCLFMLLEIGTRSQPDLPTCKGLAAELAFEWFLACMDSFVSDEIRYLNKLAHLREGFIAIGIIASIGLLLVMHPCVLL